MKFSILLVSLFLVGCQHNPPQYPKWPEQPKIGTCPDLEDAMPSEKLSELLTTVTKNYGKYHECTARVQAWEQWYKEQRAIYEEAIKK